MNGTPITFEPTPDHARDLRDAFGRFGTGVTIVTTHTDSGPLGMTANSFSAVSLDPALVLWAPAKWSLRHDAFVEAENFCIHVLGADQLDMARHFASNGGTFGPFEWHDGPLGAPILSSALAEFHCVTHKVHPAGDHSLVLGRICHVVHYDTDQPGLIFERGRFGGFSSFEGEI